MQFDTLIQRRNDRFGRLAVAIGALAGRVGQEAVDPSQLTGAVAELRALNRLIADRSRAEGGEHLAALALALTKLEFALVATASRQPQVSRPTQRRVKARSVRLDRSTQRLLGRVAAALAATTASGLTTFAPMSVAAAPCDGTTSVICTGAVPQGISYGSPVTNLTVVAPDYNIAPAVGVVGVRLDGSGATGPEGSDDVDVDAEGGPGGPGQNGRTVTLDVDTGSHAIVTRDAIGVLLQSIGGNGGEGGAADGAGAEGGDGGRGGDGGLATLITDGTITTSGEKAHGAYAVSAGGIGGRGGNAKGVDADGGDGAVGGAGGAVVMTNSATVTTSGSAAQGLFGQSVGGRGGEGGNGGGLVADGGGGGTTSNGGSVTIGNSGEINTSGDYASGVFGQSVGGYGGSGGSASGLVAFGGDGATAGAGGAVSITSSGEVTTTGAHAFGLFAQSVGGGGGSGGSGTGLAGLGSTGSAGGSGGAVSAINSGAVDTRGEGSIGVYAQSIGGGGGDGGAGTGLAGIGGSGSGTSNGGSAHAGNSGSVLTRGDNAQGVLAQSVGGGGGNGGSSGGLVSIGGSGGGGGAGGAVTAANTGSIETFGENSQGLFAQSVGGGGGNGGNASSAGLFGSVAIGGSGGAGGAAGAVTVNAGVNGASPAASIETHGVRSDGVFAQSVGGGGGNGGYAVSANIGAGASASVAIGGSGAVGGAGGVVNVANRGTITTHSDDSLGINAQSVGGGGGNGGFAIAISGSDGVALSTAIGGAGAPGAAGGQVTVNSWSDIATSGDRSHGANAQSVGGGGGNGGFAIAVAAGGGFAGALSLGGEGGGGGVGGIASLSNVGDVTTEGQVAHGLISQSVGGGGGTGGFAISGALSATGAISLGFGGNGGAGGGGDQATLYRDGDIETFGDGSYGVLAQSVGGGGGSGGFSGSIAGGVSAGGLALGFGGDGNSGGDGGKVELTGLGGAFTHGDNATAILAQSVGGGGGSGGFSISAAGGQYAGVSLAMGGGAGVGGLGGEVDLDNTGAVGTIGDLSHGVMAQSVGGGGGTGGFAISGALASGGGALGVSLGGDGGAGGNARRVHLIQEGAVSTGGEGSVGLLAQSVGGGGGAGGFSGALALNPNGVAAAVSLGGAGLSGGDGGLVEVDLIGDIITRGSQATALLAQSVGGGGGTGGFSGSLAAGQGGAASFSLGGSGGAGGAGGVVDLDSSGFIATQGEGSTAILAQSVGGGGGAGGFSISASGASQSAIALSLGGSGGTGGVGGLVEVDHIGDIITKAGLSYGVLAQSVGGGGGSGGFSVSGSLSNSANGVSASLGGSGGSGGVAGNVNLDLNGSVQTEGLGSHAVFAQSVGGGGGAGGFSGAAAISLGNGAAVGLSLGGSGGTGGNAGVVEVVTARGESILTKADGSHGLFAQSVGGGGGDGGFSLAASVNTSASGNTLTASLGGSGGTGGTGGAVSVDNHANIFTLGRKAIGLLAQSVGGGGGTGGFSASGGITPGQNGKQASVAVGGSGGSGAFAGLVEVDNAGQIMTGGDESDGIFAQSVGGGGGDGGLSFAGTVSGGSTKAIAVSVGGSGGTGGDGGDVFVDNSGLVDVAGTSSNGLFVQSVGGGGGRGGFAIGAGLSFGGEGTNLNLGVTVGGAGGAGGIGGDVEVDNSGRVIARGQGGAGVYAQSIGGGGGAGGGAFTGVVGVSTSNGDNAKARTVNANVTVGGGGGSGNHGGEVRVFNSGLIDTFGDDGFGVFAQSVGGGGGVGGSVNAMSLIVGASCSKPPTEPGGDPTGCGKADPAKNNWNLSVAVGGSGGGASNGGEVTVNNSGAIHTRGATADGVVAQSVGGGGGMGGTGTLGLAGYTDIPVALLIKPIDKVKFLQNLSVGVGGSAGSSGDGGLVTVSNTGAVLTEGVASNGIFAQSVGGGGGRGGPAAPGATGRVGIGGSGGAAGDGGDVLVTNAGRVETFGAGANGVFAQSVGGGGGVGGDVRRGVPGGVEVAGVSVRNVGIGLAFGGNGGGGGTGGEVRVTNTNDIVTHGTGASGVFAQSVGGGGGVLGDLGNDVPILSLLNFAGSVGDAGSASAVTVSQTGDITTSGVGSHGVFAQSAGGGGTGGAVNVLVNGNIRLSGERSDGLVAQSVGRGGSSDIAIDIQRGLVQGGAAGSAGVRIFDGRNNSLVNRGTITTVGGIDGLAIESLGGAESVDNYGVIVGSLQLGAGADALRNRASGEIRSGALLGLGAGESLLNEGRLSPGGLGRVQTTALDGLLTQTASGVYAIDLDFDRTGLSGEADRLNVLGSATVGGKVSLGVLNTADTLPGDHAVTILNATGGQTHAGLTLEAPVSAIAKFELRHPNASTIDLGYTIDYSVEGLNPNQTAVGDHINAIQTAGGTPAFRPVAEGLFLVPDAQSLAQVYDRMTPELQVHGMVAGAGSSLNFTDQMFSCSAVGGSWRVVDEHCNWGRLIKREFNADADGLSQAWDERTESLVTGFEFAAGPGLRLGLGVGFEDSALTLPGVSESSGYRLHGGVVAKRLWDNGAELAAAASVGTGVFDTARAVNFPGPHTAARSRQETEFSALSLRLGRTFGESAWIKPSLEVAGVRVRQDGFSETGAGPLNLTVSARSETAWMVRPSVEMGTQVEVADGLWLRPTIKVGVSETVSGDDWGLSSGFEGAPAGMPPFATTTRLDPTTVRLRAEVELVRSGGLSAKLSYFRDEGDKTRQEGAAFKFVAPF